MSSNANPQLAPRIGDTAVCEYCDRPIVFRTLNTHSGPCRRWWHVDVNRADRALCLDKPLDREARPRFDGHRYRRWARNLLDALIDRI
jgi:hypothetical protein